jgi:Large polyvalent protein-associated domain 7
MNGITEGGEREKAPDGEGEIRKIPTSAATDLITEINQAAMLKAEGKNDVSRARSDIQSRTDLVLAATNEAIRSDPSRSVNQLSIDNETARRWADLDVAEFSRSRSDARRETALESIATHMRASPEYENELKKRSPAIAEAAKTINVEREKLEAERLAHEREAQRKLDASARNDLRQSLIDVAALAALDNLRKDQSRKVLADLARNPDASVQELAAAQKALKAPRLDGRITAPDDPDIAAQHARALKRPLLEEEATQTLRTRFIITTEKATFLNSGQTEFTFRDGEKQGRVAFIDMGKSLSTELEDKATIRFMIEVAASKNWKEITLSGTDDFRRNAWLEASLNNIQARGFEPREADKALLASIRTELKASNQITVLDRQLEQVSPRVNREPVINPERKTDNVRPYTHIDTAALTPNEKAVIENSRSFLKAQDFGPGWTEQAVRELESKLRGERVYVGKLVEHGAAPFKFDDKNEMSYQVTLSTVRGEQVIWGKELPSALDGRAIGENIVLRNVGKRDVTVDERVFDDAGKQVGTRPKDAIRNAWTAEPLAKFSTLEREKLERKSSEPTFGVYDKSAPRAQSVSLQQSPPPVEAARNPTQERPGRDR